MAAGAALGEIQRSGGSTDSGTRGAAGAGLAAQGGGDLPGGVPPGQGGYVGGLGRVDQVPGREHQRRLVSSAVSTAGPRVPGSMAHSGSPGQFVVGDPVAGEDEQVAAREPGRPGLRVGQLDAGQPGFPGRQFRPARDHPADRGVRPHRDPPAQPGAQREAGVTLLRRVLGDQPDDLAPACARVTIAEKLTCSAPTTSGPAAAAARRCR